jgi:integrase/recombinase XerC
MYHEALLRLQAAADAAGVPLTAGSRTTCAPGSARLRTQGLGARSIAIALSAWRGLYRWWGRDGVVALNPVDGVRAPKAGKPLPKALSVEQAVALAAHEPAQGDQRLRARDHCIVELLYGCGLRIGELVGLDVAASGDAAGWIDVPDATAHVLGKGAKRRSVPVGAPALAALAAWLPQRAALARAGEAALIVSRAARG